MLVDDLFWLNVKFLLNRHVQYIIFYMKERERAKKIERVMILIYKKYNTMRDVERIILYIQYCLLSFKYQV